MSTLTVTGTHDYSGEVLPNTPIDVILFDYGSAVFTLATFDDSQFDGVQISTTVSITSDDTGLGYIAVNIDGTFSAAGWTFNNIFRGLIQLQGGSGADTITGNPLVGNGFIGGGGADTLIGGDQDDLFAYLASADIETGETITGGVGSDRIQIRCDGAALSDVSYDFSGATLSGIEGVVFSAGSQIGDSITTFTFSSDQIGTGKITDFQTASGDVGLHNMVVNGSSVDLSVLTGDVPTTTINGTAGVDSLIGSAALDTIIGGLAKDTMTGGSGGADIFDFNLKTDSKKGALRDVITDFSHTELDKIDLSDIDAKKGAGNQAFHFIGAKHFHDKKGELHFVKKAGFVIVEGDTNGDGKADFQIEVHNLTNTLGKLFATDFDL